jgi:hypothetical protein
LEVSSAHRSDKTVIRVTVKIFPEAGAGACQACPAIPAIIRNQQGEGDLAYGFELGIGIALGVVAFCVVAWIVSMLAGAAAAVIETMWIRYNPDWDKFNWDEFDKKRK